VPGADWNETVTTMHTPQGPLTARHLSSNRGLPGMTTGFYVKTLDDLERALSVPYEPVRPVVERFFEVDRQMGEWGIVSCELSNPLAGAHALMGSERLAIWSRTERRAIRNLVGVLRDRLLELVKDLLAAGVGPVFGSAGQEYAVPPLMSPADFREFCTLMEAPIGEAIHEAGGLLRVHCHGAMSDVLEDFVTIGCNCLHPIEPPPMGDMELAEAKRRVGHRICLEGNLQIGDLYAAPTEEVVAKTRAAIREGGPRGFILCPTASAHTEVLSDRTVANYLAMIETATRPQ
jgi:uroporphyrinogen-III decarboxylase